MRCHTESGHTYAEPQKQPSILAPGFLARALPDDTECSSGRY